VNKITEDDIRYIAELSKLELTNDEVEKFRNEIRAIIGYVEQLGDADLDSEDVTHQVSGLVNRMREDEVADRNGADNSLQRVSKQELLDNTANATNSGYIQVDRVL